MPKGTSNAARQGIKDGKEHVFFVKNLAVSTENTIFADSLY
jgi:hypothetical protein